MAGLSIGGGVLMVKRAKMGTEGSNFVFRVSRPGVDVDSAGPGDFLMHESYLFSQPYFQTFVACPFAGDSSSNPRTEDVPVSIPNLGIVPRIVLWPVDHQARIVYPFGRSLATGSDQGGWPYDNWDTRVQSVSASSVTIRFFKPGTNLRSPNGCYIIALRSAST